MPAFLCVARVIGLCIHDDDDATPLAAFPFGCQPCSGLCH
jgi:hypothetical protein